MMINLSRVPNESIIGMVMRLPLRLIPPSTVFYIIQGKLKGKKWIVGSSTHGCWLGTYEYKKQIFFSKMIKEGSIVYDIGAHVGFYTLLSSSLVGPKGKVFSFEPSPRNIHYLKQHLRLNGCDNVRIIEAAVTDKDGIAFFEECTPSLLGHISINGNLKVKTLSLDSLFLKGEIPVPDYIKIDAEGSELLILAGAKNILTNYNPMLILSIHSPELYNGCYEFLKFLNYDLQSLDENKDVNNAYELLAYKRR